MRESAVERDDDVLTDDSERGELSQEGFANADDKRNPIEPNELGTPPQHTPESGRARDPELGEKHI